MIFTALVLALIVVTRGVLPLHIKWYYKVILSIIATTVSLRFNILHAIGGGMPFAPNVAGGVIVLGTWLYGVFIIFILLLVLRELGIAIYRLTLLFARKKPHKNYGKFINNSALAMLIIAFIAGTYGLYNGLAMPKIREHNIIIPKLAQEAQGFKIVAIADLHIDHSIESKKIAKIVQLINEQNPDLIVFLGDTVDGDVRNIASLLEPFSKLHAKYGVYKVTGNHEYFSRYEEWKHIFTKLNIQELNNQNFEIPELKLLFAGVSDEVSGRYNFEVSNLEKALKTDSNELVKILFAHRPKVVHQASKLGVDLQLSGHTHGGSIIGMDSIIGFYNGGFVSGLYNVGKMKLLVANGTGIWSGFSVRIGTKSEIDVIYLNSAP